MSSSSIGMTNAEAAAVDTRIICRVCLDDGEGDKMIAPCCCKGTSLLIHSHCLEIWQTLSMKKNMLSHAIMCSTCLSFYRHPPLRIQVYRIVSYYAAQRVNRLIDTVLQIFLSILITIKSFIYFGLTVLLIFMNSQLELLREEVLALLQVDGGLRLTIVSNSSTSLLAQVVQPGIIISATDKMKADPLFASSQILIFERSDRRVRGLVLNRHSTDTRLLDAVGDGGGGGGGGRINQGAEYVGSGSPVQISSRLFIISNDGESFTSINASYIKKIYTIPVSNVDINTVNDTTTSIFIAECHRMSHVDIAAISGLHSKVRLVRGCVYSWTPCFLVGEIVASLWTTRLLRYSDTHDLLLAHSSSSSIS